MLRSYFHTAWRHLSKNKTYTSIHVAGLAIGMATALLIGLWINSELTFDHYSPNHKHIAEIMLLQRLTSSVMGSHATPEHPESFLGPTVAPVTGTALQRDYNNIFPKTAMVAFTRNHLIGAGTRTLSRTGSFAQWTLPAIFGFQMIAGDAHALDDPSTVLLSQSTAKALFGSTDPINKTIRVDIHNTYRVGGIYADLPQNTSFSGTDILLPWNSNEIGWLKTDNNWGNHGCHLFAELDENTSFEAATAKIKNLPTPYITEWHEELVAYPLDRLHLYDQFDQYNNAEPAGGRIHDVWLFGTIGTLVLLLACINFMNLSTARGERRAKEVSIRKTIGSLRIQLITQFLSESLLTALLAFTIAILLAILALPAFNSLAAKDISFPWTSLPFWTASLAFTAFTGLLAGSYPAFYLSAFNPIRRFTRRTGLFRRTLVVTQFTVSLSLIIGTVIIYRQIRFAKDRPIGYSREGLITVPINTDSLRNHEDALRNDLLKTGLVANAAPSSDATDEFQSTRYLTWSGMPQEAQGTLYRSVSVTPEFGPTVGWTILAGRNFSHDFPTDSNGIILNEQALNAARFKDPIGMQVVFQRKNYHIIGIAANMLTNSPYDKIQPAVFTMGGYNQVLTIRIRPDAPVRTALTGIESIFRRYNPESPFLFSFNDETFAMKFAAETRLGQLALILTALAIFISCLGLFALAAFIAEQRTKEIAVRKVLGAGIPHLWALLSKDFLVLTTLSMIIAMPFMAFAMSRWLQNYTYRAPLSWWIFGASGAAILLITLATVSFQSIKAALMNPIKSLRSE